MSRLTRDGTAELVSQDRILRHERGQGNIHFPCSADHEQDWQPYSVDPYSCFMCHHTYIYMLPSTSTHPRRVSEKCTASVPPSPISDHSIHNPLSSRGTGERSGTRHHKRRTTLDPRGADSALLTLDGTQVPPRSSGHGMASRVALAGFIRETCKTSKSSVVTTTYCIVLYCFLIRAATPQPPQHPKRSP